MGGGIGGEAVNGGEVLGGGGGLYLLMVSYLLGLRLSNFLSSPSLLFLFFTTNQYRGGTCKELCTKYICNLYYTMEITITWGKFNLNPKIRSHLL